MRIRYPNTESAYTFQKLVCLFLGHDPVMAMKRNRIVQVCQRCMKTF